MTKPEKLRKIIDIQREEQEKKRRRHEARERRKVERAVTGQEAKGETERQEEALARWLEGDSDELPLELLLELEITPTDAQPSTAATENLTAEELIDAYIGEEQTQTEPTKDAEPSKTIQIEQEEAEPETEKSKSQSGKKKRKREEKKKADKTVRRLLLDFDDDFDVPFEQGTREQGDEDSPERQEEDDEESDFPIGTLLEEIKKRKQTERVALPVKPSRATIDQEQRNEDEPMTEAEMRVASAFDTLLTALNPGAEEILEDSPLLDTEPNWDQLVAVNAENDEKRREQNRGADGFDPLPSQNLTHIDDTPIQTPVEPQI